MTKSKFNLIKFSAGIFFVLQIIGAMSILAFPSPAMAQSKTDSVKSLDFTPQVSIPDSNFNRGASTSVGTYNSATGKIDSTLLAKYIGAIYNYGLAIAGILATIMLMGAGVIWLTSGGDSGKVSQAKNLISGSIAGLIILVISWVILNTINPELVNLQSIKTTNLNKIEETELVCCWPKTGEIKYPVRIVDGKKIAISGEFEGKSIHCDNVMCSDNEVCRYNYSEKEYSCFKDTVCCNCGTDSKILSCKEGISIDECNNLCKTNFPNMMVDWVTNYYSDEYYDCKNNQCTPTVRVLEY